jgi:hypothetical protein
VFIYSTAGTYDEFVEGIAEEKALQMVVSTAALPRDTHTPLVQKALENKDHAKYFKEPLIAAQSYLAESLYSFATGHRHTMRWWSNFMREPKLLSKTVDGYPAGNDSYVDAVTPRARRGKHRHGEQQHSLWSGFERRRTKHLAPWADTSSDTTDDTEIAAINPVDDPSSFPDLPPVNEPNYSAAAAEPSPPCPIANLDNPTAVTPDEAVTSGPILSTATRVIRPPLFRVTRRHRRTTPPQPRIYTPTLPHQLQTIRPYRALTLPLRVLWSTHKQMSSQTCMVVTVIILKVCRTKKYIHLNFYCYHNHADPRR